MLTGIFRRDGYIFIAWLIISAVGYTPAAGQSGDIKSVPDPAIIRAKDGQFYIFSTGRGIPIHCSRDLVHWRSVGTVFSRAVPDWAAAKIPGTRGVWAPDITFYRGKYWLYYAVSTFGSQRSCIGLATNATLNQDTKGYKWQDEGLVLESLPGKSNFNAIDPAAFTDQEGGRWLIWGSFWDGIKMTALDGTTGKLLPGNPVIISLARRPIHRAIEAPYIFYHRGWYYLFVSFDACCRGVKSTYKVMVGRAKDPTGPYRDFTGKDMTDGGGTLVLAGYNHWYGPGHNSIITNGSHTYLVHHVYDGREKNGRRNLQIREIIWSTDLWPLVLEPIDQVKPARQPVTRNSLVGKWNHSVNFSRQDKVINLLSDGHIDKPTSLSSWQYDGKLLRFFWPDPKAPNGIWIDTCYLAPDGKYYVGRNRRGHLIRGYKSEKQ